MVNIIQYIINEIKSNYDFNFKILLSKQSNVDYTISTNINSIKDNLDKIVKEYENFTITQSKNTLNINLKNSFYSKLIEDFFKTKTNLNPKTILIDYSSPNVAKEMHVGHLRSTIIGDALSNFYELMGHNVLRVNHIGDFGLQFGIMINFIICNKLEDKIDELNLQEIYVNANALKKDELFLSESQKRTFELQNKINPSYEIHQKICDKSRLHFNEIYKYLNIKNLKETSESFYQNLIPDMIKELENAKILEESEKRMIVKTMLNNKESALTIIKNNGGYTYDSTDLCAIKYRSQILKADKILYVVDSGQSEHLQQIFQVAKKMNWINDDQAYHINFGIVLSEDGTRLRSRDGNTPKLLDLIIDSIDKSKEIMKDKNSELKEEDFINLGVGSLKYSDLKSERFSDYKFSLDRMISFTGNTLCYIMYGYIRTKKILEKYFKYSSIELKNYKIEMNDINEKDINLLKHILSLDEIYDKVEKSNSIHHICIYLYELVEKIHNCYKSNRVLDFDNDNNIKYVNHSRALIFNMSKMVIEEIFKVLNIQQLEFM